MVAYLDDFLAMFRTREEAARARDEVILPTLFRLGFVTEDSKSVWEPTRRLEMLGLILDTEAAVVEIPEDKLEKIEGLATMLLSNDQVTARVMARVAGTVISFSRAFPFTRMCTRELFNLIDLVHRDRWESEGQGPHLAAGQGGRPVAACQLEAATGGGNLETVEGLSGVLGRVAQGLGRTVRGPEGRWALERGGAPAPHQHAGDPSSGEGVELFAERLRGKRVTLVTDSMTAKSYLECAGGREPLRNSVARRVWSLAVEWDMLLEVEWMAGKDNVVADQESRAEVWDDWSVRRETFEILDERWGPHTCDRLADDSNAQVRYFNSKRHCPGSAGVDAFCKIGQGT